MCVAWVSSIAPNRSKQAGVQRLFGTDQSPSNDRCWCVSGYKKPRLACCFVFLQLVENLFALCKKMSGSTFSICLDTNSASEMQINSLLEEALCFCFFFSGRTNVCIKFNELPH